MIQANPILGTLLHAIGAICAALCYTPQRRVRGWSWQTYWLSQAAVCWLILPVVGALLTIPELGAVLREAPIKNLAGTFVLGLVYGIGGTAFGVSIRYIGFSLTYSIAIGISCVLGTLAGPIIAGNFAEVMSGYGANWIIWGMVVGALGILMCGLAGRRKEVELERETGNSPDFSLVRGLPLCVMAGVLSAIYGIAINDAGGPIAKLAETHGAGHWKMNVVYIFSNSGAFVTTAIYCLMLIRRQRTAGEFRQPLAEGAARTAGEFRQPLAEGAARPALGLNYVFAALTGVLWYSQFLFYGLGHVRMGEYQFSSWALHMTMLVLFSTVTGFVLKEWSGARRIPRLMISAAVAVLIAAIVLIGYGNTAAERARAEAAPAAAVTVQESR